MHIRILLSPRGKTHKQLQIITEEIRYKLGIKGRISLKQIATFIPTIESHEKVIKQAIIEQENQKSRGTFGEVLSADDMKVQKSLSEFREIDIEDIPSFKIIES